MGYVGGLLVTAGLEEHQGDLKGSHHTQPCGKGGEGGHQQPAANRAGSNSQQKRTERDAPKDGKAVKDPRSQEDT